MTVGPDQTSAWSDAMLAAALFAVDPSGLGGVCVRSAPGPVRDAWLAQTRALLPAETPFRRTPAGIDDDRLLGGLDLAASLSLGRAVVEQGVLAACNGGVAVLSMAERMESSTAARLASVLDTGEVAIERDGLTARVPTRLGLIALDEGIEPGERPPEALLDRMAFRLDLSAIGHREATGGAWTEATIAEARGRLGAVAPATESVIEALCATADALGLLSARPVLLSLRVARASAALAGRAEVLHEDVVTAAGLVLAPRALTLPGEAANEAVPTDSAAAPEAETGSNPEPDPQDPDKTQTPPGDTETLIAAIQASLPEGLLDEVRMTAGRDMRPSRAQGTGAATKSVRRGRPSGSKRGALRPGDRLNLPETLRAAIPWQKLRAAGSGEVLIKVRKDDFRIRRFVQRQATTTIFLVDASGSSAFQRLAEAKGAVELLLAKAYVSRARVGLISFRDKGASVLLEPTRSLTRAKRSLADLPGGGGTPLAGGLDAARAMAQAEKAKDRTPLIVVLTDGRTNIGRTGAPGRVAAEQDALEAARLIRSEGVGAVFIDTSARVQEGGDRFARAMGAVYAPLPYANAGAVVGLMDSLSSSQR